MKEVEHQVKEHLSKGRHNSALRTVIDAFNNSGGIEKQQYKTLAEILLQHDEVRASLGDDLRNLILSETFLPGIDLKPDKYHFTGMASFPVFNESGCRIAMLECGQKGDSKLIDFKSTEEVAGSFYTAANMILQFTQENINALEFTGNDVTVMNWGFSYKFGYNPFTHGRLATANDDQLDGDSFHFAALAATISSISEQPVDPGFIFTGAFESQKRLRPVSRLVEKTALVRKERPGFRKIVIPPKALFRGADRELIESNPDIFLEIIDFNDFIEKIFGCSPKQLLKFERSKRHSLGLARVIAHDTGIRKLELYDKIGDAKLNRSTKSFRVFRCIVDRPNENVKYNVFPCPRIYVPDTTTNDFPTLILIDYASANHYLGNTMSNNGVSSHYFSIGIGRESVEAIIFACRTASESWIIGKYFLTSEVKEP